MSLYRHLGFMLLLFVGLPAAALLAASLTGNKLPVPFMGRGYVIEHTFADVGESARLPEVAGPDDTARPLVVIDPGHGGRDPGASGSGVKEKDVVLGLALALRDRLLEQGGIRVAMTREDDREVILAERDRKSTV